MSVSKRGLCTFVEKASALATSGARVGLMVNDKDELMDLPSGKVANT